MPHWSFAQKDAFEWLAGLPDNYVDLVVTDPPYESLEEHRGKGTTTRLKQSKASSNEWFEVIKNDQLPLLMRELYRVLKKDTHCYVCCDAKTLFHLKPAGEAAGFKFWKPLVWDKVHIGMGYHYRSRYEFICFFEKGKRKLNHLGWADVLTYARLLGKGVYPAQKPLGLIEELITQSTSGTGTVIDPFFGSGVVAEASANHGLHFMGTDINPEARLRIEQLAVARGATFTILDGVTNCGVGVQPRVVSPGK